MSWPCVTPRRASRAASLSVASGGKSGGGLRQAGLAHPLHAGASRAVGVQLHPASVAAGGEPAQRAMAAGDQIAPLADGGLVQAFLADEFGAAVAPRERFSCLQGQPTLAALPARRLRSLHRSSSSMNGRLRGGSDIATAPLQGEGDLKGRERAHSMSAR